MVGIPDHALVSFFGLSVAGRAEGVHFFRSKWVGCMIAGSLCGAVSGLYDKFLLGRTGAGLTAAAVQAWFTLYLPVDAFAALAVGWMASCCCGTCVAMNSTGAGASR